MSYLPPHDAEDFGAAANLAAALNSAVTFDNRNGYSTVRVHVVPPSGATVAFETTCDDVNWISTTLRTQLADVDQYVSSTTSEDDFVGSIAGARKFRCRVSVSGSGTGSVIGRGQRDAAIQEGQEFQAPPDRIGRLIVHKDAAFTTAQTGTAIWTPATGKRFIITDMIITAFGNTDGTLTVFDNTDETGKRVFKGKLDPSNASIVVPLHFRVPYVGQAVNNVLKVTTDANLSFDILVNGYEGG